MDFTIDDKTCWLLDRARDLLEASVVPLEPAFLAEGFAAVAEPLEAVRAEVRAAGLWAPCHPPEYGGMGLDLVTHGLLAEVLGRSPLGHYAFGCQAPDAGNIELIARHGSEAQRARWLPDLVAGRLRSCFAMTEPGNSGANPLMLETTAVLDGDQWVLNGHKWFVTAADGAALAVVMAVTDPEAPPHRRASQLLVPTATPGFEHVRNLPVMGRPGSGWASHAELRLRDCRVPAEALLGGRGEGFRLAQARLGPGRIHHCMRWLGIGARALDMLTERARSRVIAPDGRRLGDSDLVRGWIADSAAELAAARLLTLRTAWRIEREGARAARDDISMIKYHVAGVLQRVLDRALQAHGALGMSDDTVLAWFYREERAARIYDGPDEVHRIAVARRLIAEDGG